MLIKDVWKFSSTLRACDGLAAYDQELLQDVANYFRRQDGCRSLDLAQLDFMLHIFDRRASMIFDRCDYTAITSGPNEHWIAWADLLSRATEKSLIQVLMPYVKNTRDPVLFEAHAKHTDMLLFYLSDDNRTLYRVMGLLKQLDRGQALFTYSHSTFAMRPLSLRELLRLRSKTGPSFEYKETSYSKFWDYLMREVMPDWHRANRLPTHLFSPLLELIQCYFIVRDEPAAWSHFLEKLSHYSALLQYESIASVNCLYGQRIRVGTEMMYLVDILIDCLYEPPALLHEKILGVAVWLARYNSSLIVSHPELASLYQSLRVGVGFDLTCLRRLVSQLNESSTHGPINQACLKLLAYMSDATDITFPMIRALSEIYKIHWLEIQGTESDYTRTREKHAPWIIGARQLSGAGLIVEDYYCFLMPTLEHSIDPVLLTPLSNYPLSYYILSEDGKLLINLMVCQSYFQKHGVYCNCNFEKPIPLTWVEQARLQYAHPQFQKEIRRAFPIQKEEDPSIYRSTVYAIKRLVDESTYVRTADDPEAIVSAYQRFGCFLEELPIDERLRLNAQRIYSDRNTKSKTVAELMALNFIPTGCAFLLGMYFARLVMDYSPSTLFRPDLERQAGSELSQMHAFSRKKVYRDYEDITREEAIRRIQMLATSFIRHDFHVRNVKLIQVSELGCVKLMPDWAKKIVNILLRLPKSGHFEQARFIYASVMEEIKKVVTILLASGAADTGRSLFRGSQRAENKNDRLLKSIDNGSFFLKENLWFDIASLFMGLAPMIMSPELSILTAGHPVDKKELEKFLDTLVQISFRQESAYLKEFQVNLQFSKCLSAIDDKLSDRCLALLLDRPSYPVDQASFCAMRTHFLIHRLASLGATTPKPPIGLFFGTGMDFVSTVYDAIKRSYNNSAEYDDSDGELLLEQLKAIIPGKKPVGWNVSNMITYLTTMGDGMTAALSGSDTDSASMSMRSSTVSTPRSGPRTPPRTPPLSPGLSPSISPAASIPPLTV